MTNLVPLDETAENVFFDKDSRDKKSNNILNISFVMKKKLEML